MLTHDQAADIFSRLKTFSSADEIECLFYGGRSALTRFANNTIHQNMEEENYGVSVRAVFGGRTARATTNKVDDENLRNVVKASEELAKLQEPDPDLLPVPDRVGRTLLSDQLPSRYFQQTSSLTPAQRAESVSRIVTIAQKHKLTAAGIFSSSESIEGIFNSRGLSQWHAQTSAEVSITMLAPDSSGWQKANSPDVANVNAERLAEIAAKKAVDSAAPREISPGKYTVVLEPAAVLDTVGFAFYDFGGLAILDQRSFLSNRIGTKLFGENISIWDDVSHPLQSGSPFDGEGLRRQRLQLVENGVVRRLVYARGTASRMQRSESKDKVGPVEPTGHGFPLPNEVG